MAKYIQKPFAINGDITEIPTDTTLNGAVSFQQGYTQYYELDPATDPLAKRIERSKMNYLFNTITANTKEWQEQTFPAWISDSGSGTPFGYQIGAIVKYTDGKFYQSLVNNNTKPPTNKTNWGEFKPLATSTVNLTGNQTIAGVKTFSSIPVSATQPTNANQVANKAYVDAIAKTKVDNLVNNGFSNSKATNGYTRLPNGLIFQWGKVEQVYRDSRKTAIFPIAFPTACLNASVAYEAPTKFTDLGGVAYVANISHSKMEVEYQAVTDDWQNQPYANIYWFAIGY